MHSKGISIKKTYPAEIMNRCFSTCVENRFYFDFVALFNSWKYYGHKTPIKVYLSGPLDEERRKKIERHCVVIDDPELQDPINKSKYIFKFLALIKHMSDQEVFIDCDTIFLNNVDHVFSHLDAGKLLLTAEPAANIHHKNYIEPDLWPAEHLRIKEDLRPFIGDIAENFTPELVSPNYNWGFAGLCKDKHRFLLEKTVDILRSSFNTNKNPTSMFEQFMFGLLVSLYDPEKEVLPPEAWMNTWALHQKPKKRIQVDDGKFAVYDENNLRLHFYHFTGGLTFKRDDKVLGVKPHMLYEYPFFDCTREEIEQSFFQLDNPLLLLFEYFCNKGL